MVEIISGNILDVSDKFMIAHTCNCVSKHARGLTKKIFNKFPEANIYASSPIRRCGTYSIHGNVINIYSQNCFGKPNEKESEQQRNEWLMTALFNLVDEVEKDVAFPYYMGCGLDGGNWDNIIRIIEFFAKKLEEEKSLKVVIIKSI